MDVMEMRNIHCELDPLSRPDGSALFALGDTMTLSAVYGPAEVRPQKLLTENATVEVLFKSKNGVPSISDKIKEVSLNNICKTAILSSQHPRTSISIIVQEMQDYGGLLACSVNSACLALLNAGIPLKYVFAADSKANFTLVFDGVDKNLIACKTSGIYTKNKFTEVINTCKEASLKIFQFYLSVIKKSMTI
ncbi:conserved hypothetical protein [Pediculus humanus corporis]|uniref:Exoribonuclease phosphorolytic domain-containing protein n=1 Tax=Pediculus humanus subsp. corporis TaxID=121224 RepID=E0W086_PEDHC|nr:uncharacterized protein Phum_PHUM547030 [Pediculus humanus corporis]EEB19042.1 conserved hypothetical protein [Pediculus humanus corporis]